MRNALGTGVVGAKEKWSFTIDVTMFTLREIDTERLEHLADYAEKTCDRIVDNSGLHNPTFETTGAEIDRRFEYEYDAETKKRHAREAEGQGFYYARVALDDTDLADCDFRYRPDIKSLIDDSIKQMDTNGLLHYGGVAEPTRLSRILKSLSQGIRILIKLGRGKGKDRRRRGKGKT